ncbi:MAG: hypothetical protein J0L82_01760 [Deltaproteobacteria bacterium]|jgi:hypothetical protein|nr:hypothetical protein [Deltaproteobacteria bacterium]
MKRFSSKLSLSNCQTGVRETVNLIFGSASKITTALTLGFTLGSGGIAAASPAITTPGGDSSAMSHYQTVLYCADKMDKPICKSLFQDRPDPSVAIRTRSCERLSEEISKAGEKAAKACSGANLGGSNFSRCFSQISWCRDAEDEILTMAEDEETSEDSFCDASLANKCGGLPRYAESRNFREEEKEAERDRLESKRALDDLNKERKEAQRDLLKKQREMQESQQDAAYEVRKMEREIAKDMADQFKEVQEGQKKAFEDAQKTYQEMDAAYIKMRQESRNMALKVDQAKDEFHGKCIAQAESQFRTAEAARLAAKKTATKKNAGSASRLAGTSRRNAANATRTRNFDYSAYLNECLNAQTGVGKSLSNSVRAAEREKAANDQFLAEQATLIEQQRQTMLKKLGEMEGVVNGQNEEIVKSTNERTQQLYEEQQRIAQKNQMRLQEFQQEQQLLMGDIDSRIQTENQQFMRHQSESTAAQRRVACSGGAARRSERTSERMGEAFGEAVELIGGVHSMCRQFESNCPVDAVSSTDDGAVRAVASAPIPTAADGFKFSLPQPCVLSRDVDIKRTDKKKNRPRYSAPGTDI